MKQKIRPLADRLVVEPLKKEDVTEGGIIVPDAYKEKQRKGKVFSVGPGTSRVTMTVKEGDTIVYGQYAGTDLRIDGTDYVIMKMENVLAIL